MIADLEPPYVLIKPAVSEEEFYALIDPMAETVQVETLTAGGYRTTVHRDGRLASTAVPGSWIDTAWLWRERLPSTVACLREILG